jgi:hypothetical protein
VPTLFEPFLSGRAVRIQLIGDRVWQIQMEGDNWLKSIHPLHNLADEVCDSVRHLFSSPNLLFN